MLKNFLLSKVSVLFLTAIVLNAPIIPAWSMKSEEEENQSSSAITVKNSNNNNENENNNGNINPTQQFHYFQDLPLELKVHILTFAAFDLGEDKKDLGTLALVCKDWNCNIVQNETSGIKHTIKKAFWRGWYKITDSQEIAIFDRFYKGALIYRPIKDSDEQMITLSISDLKNPLAGTFNLSSCGGTGQYLSINTGYRKVQTPANANKVEIWFTPWFLVDKEMPQLAANHHIRSIVGNWDAVRAPIGIFWTHGRWNASDDMSYCNYLTAESMVEVGSGNLYKKYHKSIALNGAPHHDDMGDYPYPVHIALARGMKYAASRCMWTPDVSYFVFELK